MAAEKLTTRCAIAGPATAARSRAAPRTLGMCVTVCVALGAFNLPLGPLYFASSTVSCGVDCWYDRAQDLARPRTKLTA